MAVNVIIITVPYVIYYFYGYTVWIFYFPASTANTLSYNSNPEIYSVAYTEFSRGGLTSPQWRIHAI